MVRCLQLAESQRGRTSPNPIVGCVIVDPQRGVLAEGFHRGPGTLHGEADALAKLGGKAPGATLYCNLEPCNHHRRTPPCAPAIRDAGIARVVYGIDDPIADHGGGAELLREAGIEVTSGVLAEDCAAANRPFVTWATLHRPAFTLKAAITLDGKIATIRGESKWITGEAARADVMRLRDTHDAIVVGIGTVIADDPQLTVRNVPGGRDPRRIVLDNRLRTSPRARVTPGAIIATTTSAAKSREASLVAAGATVWRFPGTKVPLGKLATRLAKEGICSVLVEGGGKVHASMLEAKLADELVVYIAPKLVGGNAPSWIGGKGVHQLAKAYGFRFDTLARFDDDLRLVATRR
jgi:diaminohydroxyphosphoribosylaminopyrimidine deaminase/5-amino-6-(5-phosphoribosylamino)uracil reductase